MEMATGVCPVGRPHTFEYEIQRGKLRKYCGTEHAAIAAGNRQQLRNSQCTERRCPRCKETKPVTEFSGPTATYCKPCMATRARELRANGQKQNPEYKRRETLARYGLTLEQFSTMLAAQGGRCAICQRRDPGGFGWHVDHDHACCRARKKSCGKCIRGILCSRCNVGIGNLQDDPVIIQAALGYLTRTRVLAVNP